MKKISLVLALLVCSLLAAQTVDQLYQKINAYYGSLSSYQADLRQENHFKQINQVLSYTGKIYFQKDRMLMDFSAPTRQRLLIQNGNAELYDASSNTLFKSRVMPQFNRMNPIEILELYWGKSEVKILENKAGKSRVRLNPKQDPLISSLEATIDNSSGSISKLSYTDKSANMVSYHFSKITVNKGIPASIWKFSYPRDVQVIQQ